MRNENIMNLLHCLFLGINNIEWWQQYLWKHLPSHEYYFEMWKSHSFLYRRHIDIIYLTLNLNVCLFCTIYNTYLVIYMIRINLTLTFAIMAVWCVFLWRISFIFRWGNSILMCMASPSLGRVHGFFVMWPTPTPLQTYCYPNACLNIF